MSLVQWLRHILIFLPAWCHINFEILICTLAHLILLPLLCALLQMRVQVILCLLLQLIFEVNFPEKCQIFSSCLRQYVYNDWLKRGPKPHPWLLDAAKFYQVFDIWYLLSFHHAHICEWYLARGWSCHVLHPNLILLDPPSPGSSMVLFSFCLRAILPVLQNIHFFFFFYNLISFSSYREGY